MTRVIHLLILSLWCIAAQAQTEQKAFVQSLGGSFGTVGNIRHEVVVGQAAGNIGTLTPTGISGNIGFLHIDQATNNNTAPIADAGEDDLLVEGTTVGLDGTQSFDPQGDGLTYQWFSLDGIALLSSTGPTPSFIAPDVLARRKYRFVLEVSDGLLTSNKDTVTIAVTDPEWVPVVYSNSTTTYAVVTINGQMAQECDYVGAYVNGECRAATEVILYQGQAYAVFNIQTELPEVVNFKVYDYSADQICEAPDTETTMPGGELGTFSNPIQIQADCSAFFAAFTASSQATCVGEPVTITFNGSANPSAQFNWDFNGATVVSGSGQGPYAVQWATSGNKSVSLEVTQGGVSSNIATGSVTVYPTSSTTVTTHTCNVLDTATLVLVFSNVYGCDSIVTQQTIYEPTAFTLIGADDYCGGSFLDVNVTAGPGNYSFEWSTGDVTETVYDILDGNYTITVTDGNGCSFTGTIQVGGTLPLEATASVTQAPSCASSVGSATVQGTGGITPYSYQWDNGETTMVATALLPGPHDVTVTDAAGCETETQVFIIPQSGFPYVSATIKEDYFCGLPGSIDVTITNGTPPFSYAWSSGQSTEDIDGLLPGIYSLTVTDQNGCITYTTDIEIQNLGDSIAIGLSQQNCTITATALNGSGPYTFSWNNGEMGDVLSPVILDSTYVVSVTDANGCFGTDTILSETGLILADFDFIIDSFEVTFTSNSDSPTHFWDFGDGMTSTDSATVHTYDMNGTYTVQYVTFSACGSDTSTVEIVIDVVSDAKEVAEPVISVSPNPSGGIFLLQAEFGNIVEGVVMVYDVLGRKFYSKDFNASLLVTELVLSEYPDGIYWLGIRTGQKIYSTKLIKQGR